MTLRAVPIALLLAVLAGTHPVAAAPRPEEDPEAAWTRALRLEGALGDLESAVTAWRAARASRDPERRVLAGLREAAVLERLGRVDAARAVIEEVLADPALRDDAALRARAEAARDDLDRRRPPEPPAESPELRLLREQRRAFEREIEQLRGELAEALRTSADVDSLRETLRDKDRELGSIRDALRDAERAARGEEGALTETEREARDREDAAARRVLSREWTRFGRELYLAGRFDDARRFLGEAVELDGGNLDARDLLARTSAPFDEREQITRGILEVLAMEQELRAEQVRGEAKVLVEEGRGLLAADRPDPALDRFDRALERLSAHPDLGERLAPLREQAAALFDAAARRAGSERRAPPPPPLEGADPRWQEAVRAILEEAGSGAPDDGAALRIFPLGSVVVAQRAALPPSPVAGETGEGFALRAVAPPVGPLLRAALRDGLRPATWTTPGAVLEAVGSVLVARGGADDLAAVQAAVDHLAAPPGRSLRCAIEVFACAPQALVDALVPSGGLLSPAPGGTGVVETLGATETNAVVTRLRAAGSVVARTVVRVPEGRAFALGAFLDATGARSPGLTIDGLGWVAPDGRIVIGLRLGVRAETAPEAAAILGAPVLVRQDLEVGALLDGGGAFVLGGLARPGRVPAGAPGHLVVVVTVGDPKATAPAEGGGRVLPLGDLAVRDPDVAGPLGVAGIDGRRTRAEAIRRWLERRAPAGVAVELEGGGLRVAADGTTASLIADDLERLRAAAGANAVTVRAWALDPATEQALLADLALRAPTGGGDVRSVRLGADAIRTRRFVLEGGGRPVPLGRPGPVAVAAAQRVPFALVERTAAAGDERSVGLEVGVRPWPGDLPGEHWLWVDVAGRSAAGVVTREPVVTGALRPDDALLLVGVANPFHDAQERPRLAVWVAVDGSDR